LDYRKKWNALEKSDNPFAIVVMTHLKMLETKKDKLQRLDWKIELRNALKISSSFLKESILFILNLDYAEEDE